MASDHLVFRESPCSQDIVLAVMLYLSIVLCWERDSPVLEWVGCCRSRNCRALDGEAAATIPQYCETVV